MLTIGWQNQYSWSGVPTTKNYYVLFLLFFIPNPLFLDICSIHNRGSTTSGVLIRENNILLQCYTLLLLLLPFFINTYKKYIRMLKRVTLLLFIYLEIIRICTMFVYILLYLCMCINVSLPAPWPSRSLNVYNILTFQY